MPLATAYPLAAAIILTSRPGHPVGRLMIGVGLAAGLAVATHQYATYGIVLDPGSLPFTTAPAWVGSWMDLQMPRLGGIEATRRLLQSSPHTGPLVLTVFDDDESVFLAMRAGARGYLVKSAPRDEIVRAIQPVAAGEAILGPAIARRVQDYLAGPARPRLHVRQPPRRPFPSSPSESATSSSRWPPETTTRSLLERWASVSSRAKPRLQHLRQARRRRSRPRHHSRPRGRTRHRPPRLT